MPNEKKKQGSTFLTATAVGVGVGAIAAVGGYFFGKLVGAEEAQEREEPHQARRSAPVSHLVDYGNDLKKGDEETRECGICFREFDAVKANNEEIHTTPCGHIFCKHCLEKSLRIKNECPFCRSPVDPDQTLRIYM